MAVSRRCRRSVGFYEELVLNDEDEEVLVLDEENGVFEVERVVEIKMRKGIKQCLVIWKGYRREEASWVRERDVTEAALRTFTNPQPNSRCILDAVSNLSSEIICSLKCGVIRRCCFNVSIRRDVFNFLFCNRGCSVSRRPGKFYVRSDFCSDFFSDNDFMYINSHNEVIRVAFPVYMYSHVKFVKLSSTRCDFREIVYVKLLKEQC